MHVCACVRVWTWDEEVALLAVEGGQFGQELSHWQVVTIVLQQSSKLPQFLEVQELV